MTVMRSLILGGTGFIGKNLLNQLVKKNELVTTYSRSAITPISTVHTHIQADLTDIESLTAAIKASDIVYHLIHTNTPAGADANWSGDLAGNLLPLVAIIEACAIANSKLVFASSGGTIYGNAAILPTPEDAPCVPINVYGVSKLCMENLLRLGSSKYGISVTTLRIANPFGAMQNHHKGQGLIGAFLAAITSGTAIQIWGDGSTIRDYIYIDDLIEAFELVSARSNGYNVYNVGSGVGRSILDVADAVEKITGRHLEKIFMPARPIDVPVSILSSQKLKTDFNWKASDNFEAQLLRTFESQRALK